MNKVFKNASWIVGCKIAQSLLNLIIGMLTARYLGPSNYGILSYVSSVIAFALPIMQLGLNQTIVKEFVDNPDKEGKILGTALLFNVVSSLFCMFGSILFVLFANAGETETLIICVLYSFTLLFQATEMTQYWFQAKLLSKYPSIASLIAYVIVACYKVYLLISGKSVTWFAFSNVLDYLIISLILVIIYLKKSNEKLSIDFKFGIKMLSRSKYYIIPSLMVVIFQHTDRIMIKEMLGTTETGLYSAAVTCVGITGFVFTAIIDSFRPVVLEDKSLDNVRYEQRVIQLYSIIIYLSLAQSVVLSVFSKPIVYILYGSEYFGSVGILVVSAWYILFSYFGSVRNVWILAEGLQKYLLPINISGAAVNIVLNYLLIPLMGAVGAAVATLITQFFTNVIIGFMIKPIRHSNMLMFKGFNPSPLISYAKNTIHSLKVKFKCKNNS